MYFPSLHYNILVKNSSENRDPKPIIVSEGIMSVFVFLYIGFSDRAFPIKKAEMRLRIVDKCPALIYHCQQATAYGESRNKRLFPCWWGRLRNLLN